MIPQRLDDDRRLASDEVAQLGVAHFVDPGQSSPHPFVVELDQVTARD
jgi:hypothetical protein